MYSPLVSLLCFSCGVGVAMGVGVAGVCEHLCQVRWSDQDKKTVLSSGLWNRIPCW